MSYFKVKKINEKPFIVSWFVCETEEEYLKLPDKTDIFLDPTLEYEFGICLQDLVSGEIIRRSEIALSEYESQWLELINNKNKKVLIDKMVIKHAEIGAAERRNEDTTILLGEWKKLENEYNLLK